MPSHSCSTVPDRRHVGDPVDTLTGAVFDRKLEFRLTGPLELWWYRHYDSSQNRRRLALGWGQTHDFDRTLRFESDQLCYEAPVGRTFEFPQLAKDGTELMRHGYRLCRASHRCYKLFQRGEPAMEFEFHDFKQPARLKRLFQGDHQILFHYDAARRLASILDSAGRSIAINEAPDGRMVSLTLEGVKGAPSQLLIAYEYDQRGNLISTRNAYGHGYAFIYDTENRMLERRGRTGFKFRFNYDEQGRCVRSTGDERLYDLKLTYQVPRQITKVQRADGGVWTYYFDATGGLTKIRDPLGGVQKFFRDATGRVVGEVDPNGNTSKLIYDAVGMLVARLPPLGPPLPLPEDPNAPDPRVYRVAANPAEYEYGRLLDLQAIILPTTDIARNLPVSYETRRCVATRSESGEPTAGANGYGVRPLGVKWWPEPERGRIFNDLGKLTGQRDEWGRLRTWNYDPSGNAAGHTDFDGGKWSYGYGPWHFLREVTSPTGTRVRYSYTPEGEVASFTDAGGTRSEYIYDLRDRLAEVRRHGNVRDQYIRDAAGNLVAKHASDGRLLLKLEIGPGNLPVKRILSSGDEHTFEYDKSGRHVLASTKKDLVQFTYDDVGNCTVEMRNGQGVQHSFQCWRKPSESVFFEKYFIQYERGADGTLIITGPGENEYRICFHPHGIVERRFGNRTREISQYDNQGRCHFKYAERLDGWIWKRRYHWSGEGELRRVEDNLRGEMTYEYDAAHRLRRRVVGGRVEDYEMDPADNLLRQPGMYEVILQAGNRLQSFNGLGVAYNDRDHVEMRQTPIGEMRYSYDSRDQLISVETPQGCWTAEYDPFGRRTRKTWAGQTTEYYWYADQLIAEAQADGQLRLYIYADALAMTPLMFLDYDTAEAPPESCRRYFIFTDQVGTPCLVEDESGAEVWRATIEPFGEAKVVSGTKIKFNLRFPGHYFDAELGLHYNRFRYYDPQLGRYLQSDPWGVAGGYNLYAYRANPLLQVDVRGLGEENLKNGKPCEDEEGNIRPARPGDDDQRDALAKAAGMEPEMVESLQQHCQDKGELLVIRDSKATGLQYHEDTEGAIPKPHDVLLKSDADSGLVKRPNWDDPRWDKPDSGKATMQANEAQLLEDGWTYGTYRAPNGEVHDNVLLSPDGKAVYGDHDLQGAYKPTTDNESAANYERAGSNGGKYRDDLNNDAGLPPRMFQHGANDDYLGPDGKPLRQPGADEKFTVIDENGNVIRINSTAELEQYYKDNGIPWPYQHYPPAPQPAAVTPAASLASCPVK